MSKLNDLSNRRFGKLRVVCRGENSKNGHTVEIRPKRPISHKIRRICAGSQNKELSVAICEAICAATGMEV